MHRQCGLPSSIESSVPASARPSFSQRPYSPVAVRLCSPAAGGDVIGRRRFDALHVLDAVGATVDAGEQFSFKAKQLRGADIFLDEPSVTATENALMAAAAAQGRTVLRNAASEPHVQDLAHFLCALGARIDGIGSNVMSIEGGMTLGGATHTIGPDHIEVGSFIGLAAVTRSALRIEDVGIEHLRSTLGGFERLGIDIRVDQNALEIPAISRRRSIPISVATCQRSRSAVAGVSC